MTKRILQISMLLIVCGMIAAFTECKKDDDNSSSGGGGQTENTLEKDYFSVEGATYQVGEIPQTTGGQDIEGLYMNQNVLPGGSSIISVSSEQTYSAFCVSVKGVSGYYKFTPEVRSFNEIITYQFVIAFSQNLTEGFEIELSGILPDGTPTAVYSTELKYVQAGTGSLQVSLSFDKLKDVDLYVVQPDSVVIYYSNLGGYAWDTVTGQYVQVYGLDVDSNPGCHIDSINNENIYYPAEYVQAGKYEVWVNMYSNCEPIGEQTNWIITAIYEGALVIPSSGVNPSIGVFPYDEPSNHISNSLEGATKVMEFTVVNEAKAAPAKLQPAPITESAKMKIEMSK